MHVLLKVLQAVSSYLQQIRPYQTTSCRMTLIACEAVCIWCRYDDDHITNLQVSPIQLHGYLICRTAAGLPLTLLVRWLET